jgi:hypothetical protein
MGEMGVKVGRKAPTTRHLSVIELHPSFNERLVPSDAETSYISCLMTLVGQRELSLCMVMLSRYMLSLYNHELAKE